MSRILLSRLMALILADRSGVNVPGPPWLATAAGAVPPPDELGWRLGARDDVGLSPARPCCKGGRPSPRSSGGGWDGVVVGGRFEDGPVDDRERACGL